VASPERNRAVEPTATMVGFFPVKSTDWHKAGRSADDPAVGIGADAGPVPKRLISRFLSLSQCAAPSTTRYFTSGMATETAAYRLKPPFTPRIYALG
jgi:hypothetical protein